MNRDDSSGRYQTRVGHVFKDSEEIDVYVGRGSDGSVMGEAPIGKRGWLGNPFTLDDNERGEAIYRFRIHFEDRLTTDEEFREAVGDLAGKTPGCWCRTLDAEYPECHGDIIAEHAERIARTHDTDTGQEDSP